MINLIKLCVGVTSVDELIEHREYYRSRGLGRADGLNSHRTRMMPKRRDEIVGKGSLYWVMGGAIRCRQLIVDLKATTDAEGRSCCDILLKPEIVNTVPQPKRPFQGWRYLKPADAPADIDLGADEDSAGLAEELARLGLI